MANNALSKIVQFLSEAFQIVKASSSRDLMPEGFPGFSNAYPDQHEVHNVQPQ